MREKTIFLIFLLIFIHSSFSIYEVVFPEPINDFFQAGEYLGVYGENKLSIYDLSQISQDKAILLAEYKDRKVIGTPFISDDEYVVPVEEGVVILDSALREKHFVPIEDEVLKVVKYGENTYLILTKSRIEVVKKIESTKTFYNVTYSLEKAYETESLDALVSLRYLYVLTDDKLVIFDISENLTEVKEYDVPSHNPSLVGYGNYVFFGDVYGSLYKANYEKIKNVERLEGTIYFLKKFGSYIIIPTSKAVYLYSGKDNVRKYFTDDTFFTGAYKLNNGNFVLIGRKSLYILSPSYTHFIGEKEVPFNIIGSAKFKDAILLLNPSNEIIYFTPIDLSKNCFIIKPREGTVYGYVEEYIKGYSNGIPELRINGREWVKLTPEENYFEYYFDPKSFDFGEIKIDCRSSPDEKYVASVIVFREKSGPVGYFLVSIPNKINEGELINTSVRNQYGEFVYNFTVKINGKVVKSTNPLELKLSPGINRIILEKPGYESYIKDVEVSESPLTYVLKIVFVIIIISGVVYFFLIRSGILPKFIKRIKKRIEDMR